jgi:uncharacterized membrane protein
MNMTLLAIAGLVFLGIHIIPATRLRRDAIALLGEGPYLGLFSLLSLISIWWWVSTFRSAPFDAPLWHYPQWWPWLKAILMLVAFILLVCGLSSPNPTLPRGGKLLERPDVGHGILAVTRHPLMWSFAIWAIAHFISQPDWRGFWFFGLFAITALGGAVLQERRKAETYGASWERFTANTSFIPFTAILQGRARLNLAEIGWWRIGVGVVLWALVLYLHGPLLGVAPLPGLVG